MRRYIRRTRGELESLAKNPFRSPRVFVQQKKVSRPGIGRSGQQTSPPGTFRLPQIARMIAMARVWKAIDELVDGVARLNRRRFGLPTFSRTA
jgi:hypothetical protein